MIGDVGRAVVAVEGAVLLRGDTYVEYMVNDVALRSVSPIVERSLVVGRGAVVASIAKHLLHRD